MRAGLGDDFFQCVLGQVFHNRRLQAAVFAVAQVAHIVHFDVSQAFGTVNANKFGIVVNHFARELGTAGYAQCDYTTTFHIGGSAEYFQLFAFHQFGQLGEFERHAHIGFVRTIVEHGIGKQHTREIAEFHAQSVFKHLLGHAFGDVHDFVFVQERSFDIDLSKFRLAVGTQIFVAEAFGDLVITVETGHHQQLFKQLRRLRQGEKLARVYAARHQIIARTFGGGTGEHRGFNVDKALRVQITAHAHRHLVTQAQVALHGRAAQINHAVG